MVGETMATYFVMAGNAGIEGGEWRRVQAISSQDAVRRASIDPREYDTMIVFMVTVHTEARYQSKPSIVWERVD